MLGLYVHIPFCSAICNYCNFNRGLFDAGQKARYLDALLADIHGKADGSPADTIYFGGGTPSLLEPSEIAALIEACRGAFAVARDAEITLEANPETVTPAGLDGVRAAGVNRVSFGVQSLRDEELGRLGRLHSADRAREAYAQARAAGFDNISLDLMMWLPQQTAADWLESVDGVIGLGPEHVSMYLLEIYPNAPLRDAMARGRWSVAPDDEAAEMYLSGLDRMDTAGYVQYEISNVARPGRASRHNLKYWTDGEWLGFGCGAHSTRAGVRWKNLSSTEEYISAAAPSGWSGLVEYQSKQASERDLPAATTERPARSREGHTASGHPATDRRPLSAEERLEDALFTGLRLTAGLDLRAVKHRYGVDVWARYGEELQVFVDEGLLIYDGRSLRLSRAGMLLAHEVMTVFIRSTVR